MFIPASKDDRLILKAFSEQLRLEKNRGHAPERVLLEWLTCILLMPPAPDDMVARVIHAEIDLNQYDASHYGFEGRSESGRRLLSSLYEFCRSYDHWQFSRWVHELSASDFTGNLDSKSS
jgi:hypothetical protein